MNNHYQYPGQELELFENAKNWKRYLAKKTTPYIKGDVLEVGAGIGETTPFLSNNSVRSWLCLEPDEHLYNIIEQKISNKTLPKNCRAKCGNLNNISLAEKFDTIIYIDVLEHIEDDRKEIERACVHLKENGYLIVLAPAFQLLYNRFDKAVGHYRRYSKRTLRNIIALRSLSEKRMMYLDFFGVLLILTNKILFRKTYPSKTTIVVWDQIFIPMSRIADKLFKYSIGKSVIGVWQNKKA
jgi:2-polyprenyl-3-methyl-5-hydroxy-6-metoxy-1,4-benzoquinol methylase